MWRYPADRRHGDDASVIPEPDFSDTLRHMEFEPLKEIIAIVDMWLAGATSPANA